MAVVAARARQLPDPCRATAWRAACAACTIVLTLVVRAERVGGRRPAPRAASLARGFGAHTSAVQSVNPLCPIQRGRVAPDAGRSRRSTAGRVLRLVTVGSARGSGLAAIGASRLVR